MIGILSVALWLVIELGSRPKTLTAPSLATFCAMFFIIYTAIMELSLHGPASALRNFQSYIFLLFLIFFESYRKRDIRQLRIIFWFSLVLMSLWMVTTLRALAIDPHVTRMLVRSSEVAEIYMKKGVGGYGLVYSFILAIPILFTILKFKCFSSIIGARGVLKRTTTYLLFVTVLILTLALIVEAGYSIALILMFIAIAITFSVKKKSGLIVFLIVTLPLLLFIDLSAFFDSLSEILNGTQYDRKLRDIALTLQQGEAVGTYETRQERYLRSIVLFFQNPVLGTLSVEHIGKHSEILDRFAQYGLFIGSMYAYCVFYLPLYYLKHSLADYGMMAAVFLTVAGISILNNIPAPLGFMLFIFYPFVVSHFPSRNFRSTVGYTVNREKPVVYSR